MEKQVLVNESSLTNIADALRNKLGDTKKVTSVVQNPLPLVQKTPNATGHDSLGSMASNSTTTYNVYTIPGAKSILIKCSCYLDSSSCVLMAASGKQDSFNYGTNLCNSVYITTSVQYKESTFEGTDTVTIKAYYKMAYYIEICGLDADGNEMPYYESEAETEIANTFKPSEMAEAIDLIGAGFKFAHFDMGLSSDSLTTQRNVDISNYIGTTDKNPFIFVLSLHTSTSSSSGSGVAVVTYYNGSQFEIIGSNVGPDKAPFSYIQSDFKPNLNQGVLGLFSSNTLYVNASRVSPCYMVLIYT